MADVKKKKKRPADYFVSKEPDVTFIDKKDDDEWMDVVVSCKDEAEFKVSMNGMKPLVDAGKARLINAGKSKRLGFVAVVSIVDDDDKTLKKMRKVVTGDVKLVQ